MSRKLIYHPLPRPGDGMLGFLLRLAEGNSLWGISALFGNASPTLEVLADFLGVSPDHEALAAISRQRLVAMSATVAVWNHRTSRFCPACLAEVDHWPQAWELSLCVACPDHRLALVDVCHGCGQPVTWSRPALLRCVCGRRLAEAPWIKAGDREVEFSRLLVAKLNGQDEGPAHLQLLDVDLLHRLAVVVGAYGRENRGTKPLKIDGFATLPVATDLVRSASLSLLDWPSGFFTFLDRLHPAGKGTTATQVKDRFGFFYSYLFKNFRNPAYGEVIHAFETYMEKNWEIPLTNRNRFLSADLRAKHTWIPAATAAATLGTSRRKIGLLVDTGKINGRVVPSPGQRKILCVDRRDLPLMNGLLQDQVDQKTACTMLGLGKARIRQLADHQVLGPAIAPNSKGTSQWTLSRTFLERLLHLTADCPTVRESDHPDAVSIGFSCRFLLRREYLLPRLMVAVIKGEILPVALARDRVGLSAWMFERKALTAWIADQIGGMREGMLTIPKAGQMLGLKQEVVYHFVRMYRLRSLIEHESGCQLVRVEEVKSFQETYILGAKLAASLRVSPRSLASQLRQAGIVPVSGPEVDGGRQYLYRKEEALDVAMRNLRGDTAAEVSACR